MVTGGGGGLAALGAGVGGFTTGAGEDRAEADEENFSDANAFTGGVPIACGLGDGFRVRVKIALS